MGLSEDIISSFSEVSSPGKPNRARAAILGLYTLALSKGAEKTLGSLMETPFFSSFLESTDDYVAFKILVETYKMVIPAEKLAELDKDVEFCMQEVRENKKETEEGKLTLEQLAATLSMF